MRYALIVLAALLFGCAVPARDPDIRSLTIWDCPAPLTIKGCMVRKPVARQSQYDVQWWPIEPAGPRIEGEVPR